MDRWITNKRWTLGAVGAGFGVLVLLAVGLAADTGNAARAAAPASTSPPTVTGTPQVGQKLVGERGGWSGSPSSYLDQWVRCDRNGGGCANIGGATSIAAYTLVAADKGHALRLVVKATNADGSTSASSTPTAAVTDAGPTNTSLPTITGVAQATKELRGSHGGWTGKPKYSDSWVRCDGSGGSCAKIAGATRGRYTLTSADVGKTLRFSVEATNANGKATAYSAATAVVLAAKPSTSVNGCAQSGGRIAVAGVSAPARLTIDQTQVSPSRVTYGSRTITARFHVSACGGPVQGALLYVTAVPFQQFTIPRETSTDRDGWATVRLASLAGFPVSRNQQLIVMFVRARKGGEPILGGISTRRLISFHVART